MVPWSHGVEEGDGSHKNTRNARKARIALPVADDMANAPAQPASRGLAVGGSPGRHGKRTGAASSRGPAVGGSPGSVHKSAPAVDCEARQSGQKSKAKPAREDEPPTKSRRASGAEGAASTSWSRKRQPQRVGRGKSAPAVGGATGSGSSGRSCSTSGVDERPAVEPLAELQHQRS